MKTKPVLTTESGEPFDIPADGSLGLLALGYVGVMLWREKRKEIALQNSKKTENEKA